MDRSHWRSHNEEKKLLEERISVLQAKLDELNQELSNDEIDMSTTKEYQDYMNTVRDKLPKGFESKSNEDDGCCSGTLPKGFHNELHSSKEKPKKKGLKIKHLVLIGVLIFPITMGMYAANMYATHPIDSPGITSSDINHISEIGKTIEPKPIPKQNIPQSSSCQKAYELGPNNWWYENCQ